MSTNTYQNLVNLMAIDSPSGFTHKAAQYIFDQLKGYGWQPTFTNKGAVKCSLGNTPTIAMAAHMDTLGAVVKEIKGDGTLVISPIGGLLYNSLEGEYCRIYTLEDKVYTGTLLLNNPAIHVNKKIGETKRSWENMHIRLDEQVTTKSETSSFGINVGDFVCFDVRYQELPSGYIKSRFLDNKASCYILLEVAKRLKAANQTAPIELFFSNYEEVGHGGTGGYSSTVKDLLVLDMAVVGDGCAGSETHCSICAKDSSGPYDYHFKKHLVQLAEKNNIPYKLDVYPYYGSDGSAALRAGNDFRVGLIGMGVSASHGNERTHKKGIEATIDLCMAFVENGVF